METPAGRSSDSRSRAADRRRRSRRLDASRSVPVPADFAASARPALYRIDVTPEECVVSDSPAAFAEQERRRTLQTVARLAGGDIRTCLRRTSLIGALENLRRTFVPYALSRRIALSIAAPETLSSCLASSEILESMTRALIWNALECVPNGAVVRVAASIDPVAHAAKIEIRDNGPLLAPGEWESLRSRLDQVLRPSDLFSLPKPEFALARQLAAIGGISLERRERPATNVVEAIFPLRPDERSLSHLSRRAAAAGEAALSVFTLESGAVTADPASTIDEIAYGSLPNGSMLWRKSLGEWLVVAPATPLDWCDWLRRFQAALHLERIRTDRPAATPAWTYHGAWPADVEGAQFAEAIDGLLRSEPSSVAFPPVTVPLPATSRLDEAHDALRLLGYRRFRQESSEWGETRIVAQRD